MRTWREWRKVSQSLTLQYDKTLYLLADQPRVRELRVPGGRICPIPRFQPPPYWRMVCGALIDEAKNEHKE